MPIYITGLSQTSAAYRKLGRDASRGLRAVERKVAEPIKRDAQDLAQAKITRIGRRWWKMRIGVTQKVIYVAPVQRGIKGNYQDPRRRGQRFADLLMDRAMEPALHRNEAHVEQAVEGLLDKVIADFNH